MKKNTLNITILLSVLESGLVFAGSMGDTNSFNNWTGLYIGINGGYSWSNANTRIVPLPPVEELPAGSNETLPSKLNVSMSGGIFGGQAGYNWQLRTYPMLIAGIETDINWSSLSGSARGNAIGDAGTNFRIFNNVESSEQKMTWFGTLRPRLGFLPTTSVFIYATGGLTYGNMKEAANLHFESGKQYPASKSTTQAGWTAGGGIEWAPQHPWSIKIEYLYYDLGSISAIGDPLLPNPPFKTSYTWTNAPQVVRAGINYHF